MEIIYFVTTPLIIRDLDLYGVEFFKSKGIKVTFFVLFDVLTPNVKHKSDCNYQYQKNIKSWLKLYHELKKNNHKDFIYISDVSFGHRTFLFYVIMTLLNINYSFVDNWYTLLPTIKVEPFSKKIARIGFFQLILKLKNRIIDIIENYSLKYFLKKPESTFCPNINSYFSKKLTGKKTKIIPYCSFNFDTFIELSKRNEPNLYNDNPYFVFIDQYLTNHPDFYRNNTLPPVSKEYDISVNKFCLNISKKYNLDYVIAFHPRRQSGEDIQYTTPYKYYYDTAKLIKNCSLVLGHYSGAIDFAVLFNKPLLLITTNEIEKCDLKYMIKRRSDDLNVPLINIDKSYEFNCIDEVIFSKSKKRIERYEEYKRNHIVYNPNNILKTYEIIFKTILQKK